MAAHQTTEWEDVQRKFGNLPPLQLTVDEAVVESLADQVASEHVGRGGMRIHDGMTAEEMDDLEDASLAWEEERALEEYRRKRLLELRKAEIGRHGSIISLQHRADYLSQVSENNQGWLILLLVKPRVDEAELLEKALERVARKFPAVRFAKIDAHVVIPEFPLENVPTLLCFKDGQMQKQLTGLRPFGGKRLTPDDVEWELAQVGALETELDENPHISVSDRMFINIRRK